MGKKAIWAIIILMSTALIGIIFIQLYWIRDSVRQNDKIINEKVDIVLSRVQDKIQSNAAESSQDAIDFFKGSKAESKLNLANKDIEGIISNPDYDDFTKQKLRYEVWSMQKSIYFVNPLENIIPGVLDEYIAEAMKDQAINQKYEYGVFSDADEDFIIVNGMLMAIIGETENMSTIDAVANRNLYTSKYEILLFESKPGSSGSLKIFFPNKTGWLWSSVLPSLISSIVFTGLILFCFSYTLYVILRQKKVSEMRTDFVNNMTHEFKTPIATISLASDSITNPMISGNPEKVVRFANIIKEENSRMLSQVEKVLQMALLDKKDFSLRLTELDLHLLISKAVSHGNLRVQKSEGTINTDFQAQEAKIQGDETHISNIIHNLLDNAIKYSPTKPEIVIRTINRANGIEMEVIDKGIGMTNESRKHIFDKFYRVHTGNLHDVKGFGLGLSYVKAIVTAHKGRIGVQSELGKGSKFSVFLPFMNVT